MATHKEWLGSTYFDELESEDDKQHYIRKLTLSNGTILDDPCGIPEDKWTNDVKILPNLDWPDIYTYLIETPSEFTKESLKAYKALEAYNFFICGHVHDVFIHTVKDSGFVYLKSKVGKGV